MLINASDQSGYARRHIKRPLGRRQSRCRQPHRGGRTGRRRRRRRRCSGARRRRTCRTYCRWRPPRSARRSCSSRPPTMITAGCASFSPSPASTRRRSIWTASSLAGDGEAALRRLEMSGSFVSYPRKSRVSVS
jgi:hypothetical protein